MQLKQGGLHTQSSNTVPSTCNTTGTTRPLRSAIDSLYLTNMGELSDFMQLRLNNLKTVAQSPLARESALAQIKLGKHLFEVASHGRHPFAFILNNPHFWLEISGQGAKFTPLLHAKIASELLCCAPTDSIIADLHQIIGELDSAHGWDGISEMWRLEFQFRIEALHNLSLFIYIDLVTSLRALWELVTQSGCAIPSLRKLWRCCRGRTRRD